METTTIHPGFVLPFKAKALADRAKQADAALDRLAELGVIELPRPLQYWASEFRALIAALEADTGLPRTIPGLVV
nr:hypothetical protein [Candidatus Sigynarchaeum springense]